MTVPVDADPIRDELRAHLANILYCEIEEIDDDVTFTELGLDSVLGIELVALINTKYRLEENLETLYNYPTPNQLTKYLCDKAGNGKVSEA